MIKCTTAAEDWAIFSSALANNYVVANTGATAQAFTFPFDSDGFTVPASSGMTNGSGQTYIYWLLNNNYGNNKNYITGII